MSLEGDILSAAILAKAAHDLRNKASAVVGARDLLESGLEDAEPAVSTAAEILADGEKEMLALADGWTAASHKLYQPKLVTVSAQTLLANLKRRLTLPTQLDSGGDSTVRVDEVVLDLLFTRLAERVKLGKLVVKREENYGLAWLVLEAVSLEPGVDIGKTTPEAALLKMLDAHPVKNAPAGVFGFRLRLD